MRIEIPKRVLNAATLLLLVLPRSATRAQRSDAMLEHARIGIIGGASLGTIVYRDFDLRLTYRRGATAGLLAEKPLTRWLAIEPELVYAQKGAYSNFDNADETIKQDFIQAPVLLRAEAPPRAIAPFAVAGAALSYMTRCDVAINRGPQPTQSTCDQANPYTPRMRHVDVGAIAGAGLSLRAGRPTLSMSARYEWGLRAMSADAPGKRRVLSYLASVEWPLR